MAVRDRALHCDCSRIKTSGIYGQVRALSADVAALMAYSDLDALRTAGSAMNGDWSVFGQQAGWAGSATDRRWQPSLGSKTGLAVGQGFFVRRVADVNVG